MEKTKYPKITRILIIIGATLVVVLLVFRVILPFIVKNVVERKLTEQLGAKTTIGDVSLSLLRGSATIREIIIDNPSGFAPKPFLSVQKVFVNIALTSLLSTEMRIERVDIHRLVLSIQRTKEGLFNFRHILKHLKSTSPPSSEKPVPVKAQPAKGIFLNLFKAEEVQISFEDYAFSESPILTELKDLAILLKSFRYPDTSSGTEGEINIKGELAATKTSPMIINSTFQLGENPPITLTSDSQEKVEDIYVPHFNPYVRRYGYIFTSGIAAVTYAGKTANGQIAGLANARFEKVQFEKSELKRSTLILGIPLHVLPRLFQDPHGTLELDLEVSGDVSNPQVSWSKLSEQLLTKTLGNAFRTGSIMLRKPFDLIIGGITQSKKDESLLRKFKEMLNSQSPTEEKEEVQKGEQKDKLKDFFKTKLMDQLNRLKKND